MTYYSYFINMYLTTNPSFADTNRDISTIFYLDIVWIRVYQIHEHNEVDNCLTNSGSDLRSYES